MNDDPLAAALEALWSKNRDRVLERAHTVLLALESGSDLEIAAREAHVLAGALGTYGRGGSAVFAEVEAALAADASPGAADRGALAHRVRDVITAL